MEVLRSDSPLWGPSVFAEHLSKGEEDGLPSVRPLRRNRAAFQASVRRIERFFHPARLALRVLEANPECPLSAAEVTELLRDPCESIVSSLRQYEAVRAAHAGYAGLCLSRGDADRPEGFVRLRASGVEIPLPLRLKRITTRTLGDGIPHPVTSYQAVTTADLTAEWGWELAATTAHKARDMTRAARGYGWQRDRGQDLLRFALLPGVGLAIEDPTDTVTFYRGSGESCAEDIERVLERGFLPNLVIRERGRERLASKLDEFLDASPRARDAVVFHAALSRKWEKMQTGVTGAVVGGSLDRAAASNFGKVVFEAQVPREVLYDPPADGVYDEEQESFIPFGLHASWITRVLTKDGTVLFDRTKDPAQRVPDDELHARIRR